MKRTPAFPINQTTFCRLATRLSLVIFIGVLFLPHRVEAQWLNAYVEAEHDRIHAVTWVEDPTMGKAIAFAGYTRSFTAGPIPQAWVALVDPSGQYIWSKVIGSDAMQARSVESVDDSFGATHSLVIAGARNDHAWLAELKPLDGEVMWQCTYPELGVVQSAVPTDDNEFVFVGNLPSTGRSLVVAKTKRTIETPCSLEWVKSIGTGDLLYDGATSISRTSDGGYIIGGYTEQYSPSRAGIVLKITKDGDKQWQSLISDGSTGYHSAMIEDVIEVANDEGNPDGFLAVGKFNFEGSGTDSAWLITRLNQTDGTERWTKIIGYGPDGQGGRVTSVVQSLDGAFVLTGYMSLEEGVTNQDLLILKVEAHIDGFGEPLLEIKWQKEVTTDAVVSFATDIITTPGGGHVVSGRFSEGWFTYSDAWLMRLNEEGEIPPDCLVDADPPMVELTKSHSFDQPIDLLPAMETNGGIETTEIPLDEEIPTQYECRPCVVMVNHKQTETLADGETWKTAYSHLQTGIDAAAALIATPVAVDGYCEVWVAQGDYYAYETVPTDHYKLRPGVHVFGGFSGGSPPEDWGTEGSRDDRDWINNITRILGTHPTDPVPRVFHVIAGAQDSTLDGFHVAGGDATGANLPQQFGGGMINAFVSPRVRNCTFYSNNANYGGAMANILAAPEIVNCIFSDSPLQGLLVGTNTADRGGAVLNWGGEVWTGDGPTIEGCTFEGNTGYSYGGGIYNRNSPAQISGSDFAGNTSFAGGGIANDHTNDIFEAPHIDGCAFIANRAEHSSIANYGLGSAIATRSGNAMWWSNVLVSNCLFFSNSSADPNGFTLFFQTQNTPSRPHVGNCTIADNTSGGIGWHGPVSPVVGNSILWNNPPFDIYPDCSAGAEVYYSDILGGGGCSTSDGNIGASPLDNPNFFGVTYALDWDSPCIDAGDLSYGPPTDITGAYRDPLPDMGAYEYFPE